MPLLRISYYGQFLGFLAAVDMSVSPTGYTSCAGFASSSTSLRCDIWQLWWRTWSQSITS